jgi:hypothetical protein
MRADEHSKFLSIGNNFFRFSPDSAGLILLTSGATQHFAETFTKEANV